MEKIKIEKLADLKKYEEKLKENEFLVTLENASNKDKQIIIYFLTGLTFKNGSLKKVKADEYLIKNN